MGGTASERFIKSGGSTLYYWSGVAFGVGVTFFFIGMDVIPIPADSRLAWYKWGGALLALGACLVVLFRRKRETAAPKG
jgi:hypothetical protein